MEGKSVNMRGKAKLFKNVGDNFRAAAAANNDDDDDEDDDDDDDDGEEEEDNKDNERTPPILEIVQNFIKNGSMQIRSRSSSRWSKIFAKVFWKLLPRSWTWMLKAVTWPETTFNFVPDIKNLKSCFNLKVGSMLKHLKQAGTEIGAKIWLQEFHWLFLLKVTK